MDITVEDIAPWFPRPITPSESDRIETLIGGAKDLIAEVFARENLPLEQRFDLSWFAAAYRRVVRELVLQALHIGSSVNRRSTSVSAGAISENVTWTDGVIGPWSGMGLTDEQLRDLGLPTGAVPRGRFPRAQRWPERWR